MNRLLRLYLLVLITLTGASILALEVLGTRVIGTTYGSSLHVWAALLTVTLLCLAAGYQLGGRLADRVPRAWMLCAVVATAGLSILLVPRSTGILDPLSVRLGLTWGAIVSALVIFAVPLTLLAMSSPYVIRLSARALAGVGRTSGAVYAVSTLGSVAGVLLVSLWMVPRFGTRTSLAICSGLLVAWATLGLAVFSRGRAAVALLLAALPPWLGAGRDAPVAGELYRCESPFGGLRVVQRDLPNRGPYRMLMVNGILQTGMPLDIDLVSRASIIRSDDYYLELLPYFHADLGAGRRGVLIGLAGGMFPRVMDFYEIDWTAVEIDAKVAQLAKAYFGFRGRLLRPDGAEIAVDLNRFPRRESPQAARIREGEGSDGNDRHELPAKPCDVVIQDGRQYLARHAERVDYLVIDAYNSDTIPFHLITREFFELARGRLTNDGLLAINYIGPPGEDFVTDSLFRTLAAVFGGHDKLLAWRSSDDPTAVQVMTVVAFAGRPRQPYPLWAGGEGGVDKLTYDLAKRRVPTARTGGMIVTDDHNPIDLARARTALDWRTHTRAAMRD